jgi:hypothetical protein
MKEKAPVAAGADHLRRVFGRAMLGVDQVVFEAGGGARTRPRSCSTTWRSDSGRRRRAEARVEHVSSVGPRTAYAVGTP